jgi:ABC-type multidrug transport system ATPase subunit
MQAEVFLADGSSKTFWGEILPTDTSFIFCACILLVTTKTSSPAQTLVSLSAVSLTITSLPLKLSNCLGVAFLDNGAVTVRGKVTELLSGFGGDTYSLETEDAGSISVLLEKFPKMSVEDNARITFKDSECSVFDVMRFVVDKGIKIISIRREERSLEDIFMEVTEK